MAGVAQRSNFKIPTNIPVLRIGALLLGVAALPLLYWLVWTLVSIGVGLALIGTIGVMIAGAYSAAPMVTQRWENWLLQLRIKEARDRPIEQMTNLLAQRTQKVKDYEDATVNMIGVAKTMQDMVVERQQQGKDASRGIERVKSLNKLIEARKSNLKLGYEALRVMKENLEDDKWDKQIADLNSAGMSIANVDTEEEMINSLLGDEAHAAVRDQYNQVFAQMDMETSKLDASKQIDFGGGVVVDLAAVPPTKQLEHARS